MKIKENKGFSLVEVIVTIAIMAIVIGASVGIYSWVNSSKIKKAARNLNSSISDLRSTTRSKTGTYKLSVEKDNNDVFKANIEKQDASSSYFNYSTSTLGKEVKIYCKVSGITYDIGSNGATGKYKIEIQFNRASGAFSKIKLIEGSNEQDIDDNKIYISLGNREYTIKLVQLTGKHYIE